jgi:hypothetical protein
VRPLIPRGDTHFAQEARGAPRLPPCWWRRGGAKSPGGPLWESAVKTASHVLLQLRAAGRSAQWRVAVAGSGVTSAVAFRCCWVYSWLSAACCLLPGPAWAGCWLLGKALGVCGLWFARLSGYWIAPLLTTGSLHTTLCSYRYTGSAASCMPCIVLSCARSRQSSVGLGRSSLVLYFH